MFCRSFFWNCLEFRIKRTPYLFLWQEPTLIHLCFLLFQIKAHKKHDLRSDLYPKISEPNQTSKGRFGEISIAPRYLGYFETNEANLNVIFCFQMNLTERTVSFLEHEPLLSDLLFRYQEKPDACLGNKT